MNCLCNSPSYLFTIPGALYHTTPGSGPVAYCGTSDIHVSANNKYIINYFVFGTSFIRKLMTELSEIMTYLLCEMMSSK